MKLNDFFEIQEFVPPQIWNKFGEKSLWLIDPKIIEIATEYRKFFKVPIIINNWNSRNGPYMYRGYRPPRVNIGSEYSQHKMGRAFDFSSPGTNPEFFYNEILKNQEHFMKFGLTTLEDISFTKTWLHSDCRETNQDTILIVKPL